MRAHIRIVKQTALEPGKPHIVTNDRLIAVAEDGTEVDISNVVTAWHEHSQVGGSLSEGVSSRGSGVAGDEAIPHVTNPSPSESDSYQGLT